MTIAQDAVGSEHDLVASLQQRQTEAFAAMVERYANAVYRAAYQLLGNEQDAQDVGQETFLTAYQKIGQFRGEAALSTWLVRIAINLAKQQLRQRKVLPADQVTARLGGDPMAGLPDCSLDGNPEQQLLQTEMELHCLHLFVEFLPPKQRLAFTLAVTLDLPIRDVAYITGMSESAVKTNVHRARRRIMDSFGSRCPLISDGGQCICSSWAGFALKNGLIGRGGSWAGSAESMVYNQMRDAYREIQGLRRITILYRSHAHPIDGPNPLADRLRAGIAAGEWPSIAGGQP